MVDRRGLRGRIQAAFLNERGRRHLEEDSGGFRILDPAKNLGVALDDLVYLTAERALEIGFGGDSQHFISRIEKSGYGYGDNTAVLRIG